MAGMASRRAGGLGDSSETETVEGLNLKVRGSPGAGEQALKEARRQDTGDGSGRTAQTAARMID